MLKILFLYVMLIVGAFATSKAVIIFDASGSMWGQIAGKAKISIAKNALKDVVINWNDSVELGVMAYGHRHKGDCNDIEMISSISKVDRSAIISKVRAISPKGKTPISRALKKASEKLKYTEDKATIILISDGKETCDGDPCVVAKELKAKGIDFVTHVIGFNVDKRTSKQLSCIASVTGGEYFSAKNAQELNKAIKSVAKKVQKAKPKSKPKPKIKKLEHTLEVSASESEGSKWIDASCRAYSEGKRDSWAIHPRKTKVGTLQIPVGKYTLKCSYNAFNRDDIAFEVKPDEITKLHIVMGETGKVEVSASESEGSKWIDASCRAYSEGKRDSWAIHPRKTKVGTLQIPVGKYTLKCSYNAFNRDDIAFEVKPDEITKLHIVMGETGKVEVSASESEGSKWIDASCRAYSEDKRDSWAIYPRKTKVGTLQIPVGKYTLNCSYNSFKKRDIPFEVKAGETTKLHIYFSAIYIGSKGISPCMPITYEFIKPTGQSVLTKKSMAKKRVKITLDDGLYFVEASAGDKSVKTKIEIGKDSDIVVDFGGSDESLKLNAIWKINGINDRVELHQLGDKVNGSYPSDNGRIIGEMTYPQRFDGYWIENGSNEKCSTQKDGSYHWGRVTMIFDEDICEAQSAWSYCNKKPRVYSSYHSYFVKALPHRDSKEELIKADSNRGDKVIDKEIKQKIENVNKDVEEAKKMIEMMSGMLNPNQKPTKDKSDMSLDDVEFFTK